MSHYIVERIYVFILLESKGKLGEIPKLQFLRIICRNKSV